MTNRSSSLDPAKLEYINKQHLLREASTPQGLDSLARRVLDKGGVAAQFSDSEHIGLDNVKQAIVMLEVGSLDFCNPVSRNSQPGQRRA